jgi:diaminopimelate epimerase
MYYWNADGSRAEMCGNGARCVVRLACDRGETAAPLRLETDAGSHAVHFIPAAKLATPASVEIDMGAPEWSGASLPRAADGGAHRLRIGDRDLEVHAVSMGNPHAIVLVADRAALETIPLAEWGRELSEHAAFPAGANASFVAQSDGALHLRVWERGAGATLACGTATCAAYAVASRARRFDGGRIRVHVPGGSVEVWEEPDGHLWLAGPAEYIASGEIASELWNDLKTTR